MIKVATYITQVYKDGNISSVCSAMYVHARTNLFTDIINQNSSPQILVFSSVVSDKAKLRYILSSWLTFLVLSLLENERTFTSQIDSLPQIVSKFDY